MSGTDGSPVMHADTGREPHPHPEAMAVHQHPQPSAGRCRGGAGDDWQHPQAAPSTACESPGRHRTRVGAYLPCPAGPREPSDPHRPLPAATVLRPLARALLAAAADLHAARKTLPGSAEPTKLDAATGLGLRMGDGRVVSPSVSPSVSVPVCPASVETDGCASANAHVSAADGPSCDDCDSMDRM